MPDSENPSTPKRDDTTSYIAAEVTDDEFHALADEFLEKLNDRAEAIQEGREDVEVEFSVSLATILLLTTTPAMLARKQHRSILALATDSHLPVRRPHPHPPSQRDLRA